MQYNTSQMSEEKKKRTWKKVLTAITLLILVLLVYFSRQEIASTFSNLERVNIWVLLLIPVWQLLNYHSYTMVYKDCFAILKTKIPYRPMYRIALELNFVNNVFPTAGVSGFSYFGLRMKQFDVSAGKATLVHMFRFIAVFISFQILLFVGLFALSIGGKVSNFTIMVASSLATFLLVGTIAVAYIIGSRQRIDRFFTVATKGINRVIQVIRPKHPETISILSARKVFLDLHENYLVLKKNYTALRRPLFYALLANTTEIATIYTVYLAFDTAVNPGAIIIAYVIANFAGLISVLPGGVGVYEALTTAVMATVGVPPAVSIPAIIMYRVLSSAVQLPPGYFFYHKAINNPVRGQ
jgi:glycosyltransferase 2 family protein